MRPLEPTTVLDLARQQQQSWIDEDVAQRIAAGAAAAVDAVRVVLADTPPSLLVDDSAGFLATLEALAGDST
jgi:hypothetical protein